MSANSRNQPGKTSDAATEVTTKTSISSSSTGKTVCQTPSTPSVPFQSVSNPAKKNKCDFSPPSPDVHPVIFNRLESLLQDRFTSLEKILLERSDGAANKIKLATTTLQNATENMAKQFQKTINDQVKPLENKIKELTEKLDAETNRRVSLEAVIKRKNLRVHNIPETVPHPELTDYVLDTLQQADANVSSNEIDMIYRYGRKTGKTPRSVIITFTTQRSRNSVLSKSSSLRNLGFPISTDLPQEWIEKRKKLRPFLLQARRLANQGKENWRVRLHDDKLMLNDKLYSVSNLQELPSNLSPMSVSTPMDHHTILFFTESSPFSNHYPSDFTVNDIHYNCAEQYIMAQKAQLFKDQKTFQLIMKEADPKNKRLWEKQLETLTKNCGSKK